MNTLALVVMDFYQLITVITAFAACGVLILAVLDRRVRLKLTARLDQDADGEILRVRVTNNGTFPVVPSFIGIVLKDGSEHQVKESWSSDPPSFRPRGLTWKKHFPLKFRAHESNRGNRKDFSRNDLRAFVVRTAHGKKEYKVPIKGL